MIEQEFTHLLQNHSEALTDRKRFAGLLKDLMPGMALQTNLLLNLFDIDICNEIDKIKQIDYNFVYRFVKRLRDEYGVSKDIAEWAVTMWCVCYGELILRKSCEMSISDVSPNNTASISLTSINKETSDECIFSAGNYNVGADISEGRYDIFWISGRGICFVNDKNGYPTVHGTFGKAKDCIKMFKNAKMESGGNIEIYNTLSLKFIKNKPYIT
jgi:hypothetical protein